MKRLRSCAVLFRFGGSWVSRLGCAGFAAVVFCIASAAFVPVFALASTCTTYGYTYAGMGGDGQGSGYFSQAAALSAGFAALQSSVTAAGGTSFSGSCGATSCTATYTNHCCTDTGAVSLDGGLNGTAACPVNPCSSLSGTSVSASGTGTGLPQTFVVLTSSGQECEASISGVGVEISGVWTADGVLDGNYGGSQIPGNVAPSSAPVASADNCILASGVTGCVVDAGEAENCAVFNGNESCVTTTSQGQCVANPDGSVLCFAASGSSAVASPPAPNNGTVGSAATPSATAIFNPQSSSPTTADFYSPLVVGQSSGPSQASGSGTLGSSTPSSSAAAASASASASFSGPLSISPSAANGDCGAANCTSPGTLQSTWTAYDGTFQSATSTFLAGLEASPLVSGASAITASWPSSDCDLGTVTLATLGGAQLNYSTVPCELWSQDVAPILPAVCLAIWAVMGIIIVLTA